MQQLNRPTASSYYQPKVRDLMTREPLSLVETDSVKALLELMSWRSIRHVPVCDVQGTLVGLVTQRDFLTIAVSKLAHISQQELDDLYGHMRIGDIMGRKITTVGPNALLSEAADIMFKNKFGCLPVVSEGKLVGIITESDFVKAFTEREARFGR